MKQEQIDQLQALYDAGTQGEWSWYVLDSIEPEDNDAALVLKLHNLAPALLEAARENLRLREALAESGVDLSKALIEVAAKRIYNSWNYKDGWVPWQRKENSDMQFYARQEAAREAEKAMVETLEKETA